MLLRNTVKYFDFCNVKFKSAICHSILVNTYFQHYFTNNSDRKREKYYAQWTD